MCYSWKLSMVDHFVWGKILVQLKIVYIIYFNSFYYHLKRDSIRDDAMASFWDNL